jgi:O-acetyl-ADP-ribose deacetylase (regulator of RNase III)
VAGSAGIEFVRGDITRVAADAIVNAANQQLLPGGGVCGAIHSAGGPIIAEECRAYVAAHGPVRPGHAAATSAGRLPARYVIHAVGPVYRGGHAGESETLTSAYRFSLDLAEELGLESIAFPSISTGIYGFPLELAAPVAIRAVREWLEAPRDGRPRHVKRITFVLFDDRTYESYRHVA